MRCCDHGCSTGFYSRMPFPPPTRQMIAVVMGPLVFLKWHHHSPTKWSQQWRDCRMSLASDPKTTVLLMLYAIIYHCIHCADVLRRTAQGFVCNFREHWLTIRRIGHQWFNLNSLLTGPELLSDTYLSLFLTQLQHEGTSERYSLIWRESL